MTAECKRLCSSGPSCSCTSGACALGIPQETDELVARLHRLADEIVLERQPPSQTTRNAAVAMMDAAYRIKDITRG